MWGKFLAAWCFAGIAFALTFPIWLTVNYLGNPDNGAIAAAYVGSLLVSGGFLAIGSCMSALTRNQVIAFILTALLCFFILLSGWPLVLDLVRGWAPAALVDAIASLSFLSHFESISKGVIDLRDVLVFRAGDRLLADGDRDRPRHQEGKLAAYGSRVAQVLARTSARRRDRAAAARACSSSAWSSSSTMGCAGVRADLTENRLYTLAPGTRKHPQEHRRADQLVLLFHA